ATIQNDLEKLNSELARTNEEVLELQKSKEKMVLMVREKESNQRRLASALEKLVNARMRIEMNLSYLKEILKTVEQRLQSYEELIKKHEDLKKKISNLGFAEKPENISEYVSKLEGLRKRRQEIIQEIINANDILVKAIGYATAQKFIKKIKNNDDEDELLKAGLLEGYLGRLSDIIKPKEGYEKIINAVLEYLKDPLVFSASNKKIMSFLKSSARKRAVFLNEIIKRAPCQNSVLNYVEYNEQYKNLVENLLGRVCTSNGECCEAIVLKDGTIISRGIYEMGQLEALKLDVEEFAKKLSKVKESTDKLTEVISKRTQIISEISNEILELKQKLTVADTRSFNNETIKELENLINGEEEALQRYTFELGELKQKLEKNSMEINKYERIIHSINEKIENIKNRLKSAEPAVLNVSEIETKINESLKRKERLEALISEKKYYLNETYLSLNSVKDRISVTSQSIIDLEKKIEEYKNKAAELNAKRDSLFKEKKDLEFYIKDLESRVKVISEAEASKEQLSKEKDRLLKDIKDLNRKIEKLKVQLESIESEEASVKKEIQSIKYDPYELIGDYESLISNLEQEQTELGNRVNKMAEKDYSEYYRSYKEASSRRNELEKDRDAIMKFIEDIDRQKKDTFIKAFQEIDKKVRDIFKQIVDGNAWLELENPDNPFEGGVFLIGQFGDKQPRESASLSGGEKAVLSVSFLMAIQSSYPSNFYIFDEIDANLDAERAERLGNFLKNWAQTSQIILISLKDTMISKADKVFGVYEREGVSKVLPLEMNKIVNEQQ
ncbi:MAG: hypothetical protein ACP5FU_02575, partial [Nitrososphaeria archaeon]